MVAERAVIGGSPGAFPFTPRKCAGDSAGHLSHLHTHTQHKEQSHMAETIAYQEATLDATGLTLGGGEVIPKGRYAARLIASEAKTTQNDKPFVLATWEFTGHGEQQFTEFGIRYYTSVTQSRDKKGNLRPPFSRGIAEIVEAARQVGNPFTAAELKTMPTDANKLANLYAKKMRGKSADILVTHRTWTPKDQETGEDLIDEETGKKVERLQSKGKVVKPAAAFAAVPAATVDTGSGPQAIGVAADPDFDDFA